MSEATRRALDDLRGEFRRWDDLLAGFDEEAIAADPLPNGWTVADLVGHLAAWQRVTIARLEAARRGGEPVLPDWLEGDDPDADDVDPVNARIHARTRNRPWDEVRREWRAGFERVIELGEALPADDLETPGRYPWLGDHPLLAVLEGTRAHHREDHLGPLRAWIRQRAEDPPR